MADQPRNHPLRTLANRLIDTLGVRDAVDGAIKAANESGLPLGVGGPADAYRHLLIAGELRRRFAQDDAEWTIEEGSVLAPEYMAGLGTFDVVYSWGVLHHTGRMWDAVAAGAQGSPCTGRGSSAHSTYSRSRWSR